MVGTEGPLLVTGEGGVTALVRAALPSVPVVGWLPGVRKRPGSFDGLTAVRPSVTVERDHLEAYADLCGFTARDAAPPTYPHVVSFPLHLALMSDPAFPAPAVGTVHLASSIVQHRPVLVGETVDVSTSVLPGRPHPRGRTFDFVTTVHAADRTEPSTVLWESTTTYLRRGGGDPTAEPVADGARSWPDVPPGPARWRLPADLGRRYAAVSGDLNPIHLSTVAARAFGFRRRIAHGMWTLARSVASLENRLPGALRIEATFRKPVLLPGAVSFGSEPLEDGYAFAVTGAASRGGAPPVHLVGRATAL